MISSATIFTEEGLIVLLFLIFLIPAILYTLPVFIYNKLKKKEKKGSYYLLSFLVSGIMGGIFILFFGYAVLGLY